MGYLNVEIERCSASLKRRQDKLDEMAYQAGNACCPGCFYGVEWRTICDKQSRAREWLVILLNKRGSPDDLDQARAIQTCAWP
jgi:hypothetical protein